MELELELELRSEQNTWVFQHILNILHYFTVYLYTNLTILA